MCKKSIFPVILGVCDIADRACADSCTGKRPGSFSGTVTDKSGSSISGAIVRAISEATGISREVKTDEVGHYLILPEATSELAARCTWSFRDFRRPNNEG